MCQSQLIHDVISWEVDIAEISSSLESHFKFKMAAVTIVMLAKKNYKNYVGHNLIYLELYKNFSNVN